MSILDVLKGVVEEVTTGGKTPEVDPYETGSIETVDIDLTGEQTEVTEVAEEDTDGGLVDKTTESDINVSDLLTGVVSQLKGKEDAPDTTEVNAITTEFSSLAGEALEDEETRAMITKLLKDVSTSLKEGNES